MNFNFRYNNVLRTLREKYTGEVIETKKEMPAEEAIWFRNYCNVPSTTHFEGTYILFREYRLLFDAGHNFIGWNDNGVGQNPKFHGFVPDLLSTHVLEGENYSKYNKNDVLGSSHWMNTLMGHVLHIGYYMTTHETIKPEHLKAWGQQLKDVALDVSDWHKEMMIEKKCNA